jgi:gamma-glutamylcyclotransferase (GGCT)/AIG2-like uncharacterized protein YtfP
MSKTNLVAVYGSLRKGLHNHNVLGASPLVGEYDTEPIYDMYSVGGSYPGMVENGSTSIKMEVYRVDQYRMNRLDTLEGYVEDRKEGNHYNKILIETPYGKAHTYVYNYPTSRLIKVDSGDWKSFRANIEKQFR